LIFFITIILLIEIFKHEAQKIKIFDRSKKGQSFD